MASMPKNMKACCNGYGAASSSVMTTGELNSTLVNSNVKEREERTSTKYQQENMPPQMNSTVSCSKPSFAAVAREIALYILGEILEDQKLVYKFTKFPHLHSDLSFQDKMQVALALGSQGKKHIGERYANHVELLVKELFAIFQLKRFGLKEMLDKLYDLMSNLVCKAAKKDGWPFMSIVFFALYICGICIRCVACTAEDKLRLVDCVLDSCYYAFDEFQLENLLGSWDNFASLRTNDTSCPSGERMPPPATSGSNRCPARNASPVRCNPGKNSEARTDSQISLPVCPPRDPSPSRGIPQGTPVKRCTTPSNRSEKC